jgi:hypothetical protein
VAIINVVAYRRNHSAANVAKGEESLCNQSAWLAEGNGDIYAAVGYFM